MKKGDDGKGTGKLLNNKEGEEGKMRQPIQHNNEGKILNNSLMNTKSTPIRFTLELDGNLIFQQVRYHRRSGSKTVNGRKTVLDHWRSSTLSEQ